MMFNVGCKILPLLYTPNYLDIEQGTYLTKQDIKKIYIGLTKYEVLANIGEPTLQDLFGSNTWYYVYYHHHTNGHSQYQTVTLKFDLNEILISMNIVHI